MTNDRIFRSILALDSYNRGYEPDIIGLSSLQGTRLGNATIGQDSTAVLGEGVDFATGFYAISYILDNGERVISYRGTDAQTLLPFFSSNGAIISGNDGLFGYGLGLGSPEAEQALQAAEFYRAIVEPENIFNPNAAVLVGHSLGGGLAGYVAALFNQEAFILDNMAFEAGAANAQRLASEGPSVLRSRIYGDFDGEIPTADIGRISGAFVDGELLDALGNRSTQLTALTELSDFRGIEFFAQIERHAASLTVLLQYADINTDGNWQITAEDLFDSIYSTDFSDVLPTLGNRIGAASDAQNALATIIAYSAIEEGERPFGDTGIRALFNDTGQLGSVLSGDNVSVRLENISGDITDAVVQFAGKLALGAVLSDDNPDAVNGILDLSNDAQLLTVNFSEDRFDIGAANEGIVGRDEILRATLSSNLVNIEVETDPLSGMIISSETFFNSELLNAFDFIGQPSDEPGSQIDRVAIQTTDSAVDIDIEGSSNGLTLASFGNGADIIRGSETDDLIDGGGGSDFLRGGGGNDILVGGEGNDDLAGGLGNNFIIGGVDDDILDLGIDINQEFTSIALRTIDDIDDDEIEIIEINLNRGASVNRLLGVETIRFGGDADFLNATDPLFDANTNIVIDFDRPSGGHVSSDSFDTLTFVDRSESIEYNNGRFRDNNAISPNFDTNFFGVTFEGAENIVLTRSDDIFILSNSEIHDGFGRIALLGGDDTATISDLRGNLNGQRLEVDGGIGDDEITVSGSIMGGVGVDILGDDGDDILTGGSGDDVISGGNDDDMLTGGGGSDNLSGGAGDDVLNTQDGGVAGDSLTGGTGADQFLVDNLDVINDAEAADTINFDGLILAGGEEESAGSGIYIGVNDEIYLLSGETLVVLSDIGSIVVQGFTDGDAGIFLRDIDDDDSPPGRRSRPGGPFFNPPISPIIFDLNGDGVRTIGLAESAAYFDLDGDGRAELTSFVSPEDGLLALDRNGNGTIDNITELFGSETRDGFFELDQFLRTVESGEGVFSDTGNLLTRDDLRVWIDSNSDGISQADELFTLEDLGITEIPRIGSTVALDSTIPVEDRPDFFGFDENGNRISSIAQGRFADGSTFDVADIFFNNDPSSIRPTEIELDPLAAILPDLPGGARFDDLRQVASENPELRNLVLDIVQNASSFSGAELRDSIENLLFQWTGVGDETEGSRGQFIDPARLAVLEQIFGQEYQQTAGTNAGTPNPGPAAANELNQTYELILDGFVTQFSAQIFSAQTGLVSIGEFDVSDLLDSPFLALNGLFYDNAQGISRIADFDNLIQSVVAGIPDGTSAEKFDYLDLIGSTLIGLRQDLFNAGQEFVDNGLDTIFEDAVRNAFASIDDFALRELAIARTLGAERLVGTDAASESIVTSDPEIFRDLTGLSSILEGGLGDDVLIGRTGGDIYVFSPGDGADIVVDQGAENLRIVSETPLSRGGRSGNPGGVDRFVFLDRNIADVQFAEQGTDLLLIFNDNPDDRVLIRDVLGDSFTANGIEQFIFQDGIIINDRIDTMPDDNNAGSIQLVSVPFNLDDVELVRGIVSNGSVIQSNSSISSLLVVQDGVVVQDIGVQFSIFPDNGGLFSNPNGGLSRANRSIVLADGTILNAEAIAGLVDVVTFNPDQPTILAGSIFGETIIGGDFDDQINASDGDDIIIGGLGDDRLIGDFESALEELNPITEGSDTYIYRSGDGNDSITEFGNGQVDLDVLELTDLNFGDVAFSRIISDVLFTTFSDGDFDLNEGRIVDNLIITDTKTGQKITIEAQFSSDVHGLEEIRFSDGQIIDRQYLLDTAILTDDLSQTSGGPALRGRGLIYGGTQFSEIIGTSLNSANPFSGSDLFLEDGFFNGLPTDLISLDQIANVDTAVFDVNSISQSIRGIEVVYFRDALSDEITIGRNNDGTLSLTLETSGEQVTVDNFYASDGIDIGAWTSLRFLRFSDGEILGVEDIVERASLSGTDGDDVLGIVGGEFGGDSFGGIIDGGDGNDQIAGSFGSPNQIIGGNGDDILDGGNADDTFIALDGDGNDQIFGDAGLDTFDGSRLTSLLSVDLSNNVGVATTEDPCAAADEGTSIAGSVTPVSVNDSIEDQILDIIDDFFSTGTVEDLFPIITDFFEDSLENLAPSFGVDFAEILSTPVALVDSIVFSFVEFFGGDIESTLSAADNNLPDFLTTIIDGFSGDEENQTEILDNIFNLNVPFEADDLEEPDGLETDGNVDTLFSIERVIGGRGNDRVFGSDNDEIFIGNDGDDQLFGQGGDDILTGGAGADILDGGEGFDTADFSNDRAGIELSLADGVGTAGEAAGDTLISIERVIGSNFIDNIEGSASDDNISLGRGNDIASGGAGNDILEGGGGNDQLAGGIGDDFIEGGDGADILDGGDGFDILTGGLGDDILRGGLGDDEYVITRDSSNDRIEDLAGDSESADVIFFGDLQLDQVSFQRFRGDLIINFEIFGSVTVSGQFNGDGEGIEFIEFSDDTSLDRDAISQLADDRLNGPIIASDDLGFLGETNRVFALNTTDLTLNDFDFDDDELSISEIVSSTNGVANIQNDGTILFTPDSGFAGLATFTYLVTDGFGATDTANVEIEFALGEGNDAPTVSQALADISSNEDAAINIAIPADTFSDVDGDALTLSASLVDGSDLPAWLSFDGSSFTGTPPQDFNGVLDIEVTASDAQFNVTDSFTFTINPINDAPEAMDDDIFLSEGAGELTIDQADLLENDVDVDGDLLEVVELSNGQNGVTSFDADGNVVYTPNAGFSGTDSFEYTVSDGALTSTAIAQVRIDDPFSGFRQGTEGRDFLFGNFFRNNQIFGRGGNDWIFGGFRSDDLAGGDGNDRIFGRFGNDDLYGGQGNDLLFGGFGLDTAHFTGDISEYNLQSFAGGLYVQTLDTQPGVNGNDGFDQLFSIERLAFAGGDTISVSSPIILDLDGDGTELVSAADSNALYDLDGDGVRDDTSWIGSGDGFLFIDRNGDGVATDVSELSFVDDAEDARSDLDGLRSFDSNADGALDASDERFGEFGIWQDLNTDGLVDAGEIFTLDGAGVASINLNAAATEEGFSLGDVAVVNEGQFTRNDGSFGDYADAAITFFEQGEVELPDIEFGEQDFRRKSKKYRLSSIDGQLSVASKKGRNPQSLSGTSLLSFRNRDIGLLSTIILDLDGDGIDEVRGNKTDALFDLDGNGVRDDTGWIGRGDGFLVADINGNGTIDDGSELSFLANTVGADGALQGLTLYDSNADGIISNVDIRFGELQIWVDANENGITDTGELRSLEEVGIASLSLNRQGTTDRTKVGRNIVQATSSFTRTDGTTGSVGETALSFTPGADPIERGSIARGARTLSDRLSIQERSLPDVSNVSFADVLNGTLSSDSGIAGLSLRSGNNGTTLERIEADSTFGVRSADGTTTLEAIEGIGAADGNGASVRTSDGETTLEVLEPDSDAARLALITQEMNSFGSTSGLEQLRRQNANTSIPDIFAA